MLTILLHDHGCHHVFERFIEIRQAFNAGLQAGGGPLTNLQHHDAL